MMKCTMFLAAALLGLLGCLHGVDSFTCGARKVRAGGCARFHEVHEQMHRDVSVDQCADKCRNLEKCASFVYESAKRACYILNGKCPVGGQKHRFSYHEFERCRCIANDPCGSNAVCVQKNPVEIECRCKAGYALAKQSKTHCVDVDECMSGTHACDRSKSVCVNTRGGHHCACSTGYAYAGNSNTKCEECKKTVKAGVSCVFPFKYSGKTYHSCTEIGGGGKMWCATGTNKKTLAYTSWQYCDSACFRVDGVLSQWTSFSKCSKACGKGTQSRKRTCTPPKFGGKACASTKLAETRDCNPFQDGTCDKCKATKKGDVCVFPFKYSGKTHNSCTEIGGGGKLWCATGVNPKTLAYTSWDYCQTDCHKVDGKLSAWSAFSKCSKECDEGTKKRTRKCDAPKYGGAPCNGKLEEIQICKLKTCAKCEKTTNGKGPCKFPFKYSGKTYTKCTSDGYGKKKWCATGTNAKTLAYTAWGECDSSC